MKDREYLKLDVTQGIDFSNSIHIIIYKDNMTIGGGKKENKYPEKYNLSYDQFDKMIKQLQDECNLFNWKDNYDEADEATTVLETKSGDPTTWYICYKLEGEKKEHDGRNSFPKEWEHFLEVLDSYIKNKVSY